MIPAFPRVCNLEDVDLGETPRAKKKKMSMGAKLWRKGAFLRILESSIASKNNGEFGRQSLVELPLV